MKRSTLIQTTLGVVASVALFCATDARANNTTHSLFGIDVSSYQGYVSWSAVSANGADFGFAKATEGTATNDSDFAGNMSRGKGYIQMGAYHFAYPAEGCPSVQANHFWNVAGGNLVSDGKSVMPMVDCEEFTGIGCSEGTYTTWYNDWATDLKTHKSSLRPVIYVSACNASFLNTGIADLGAWIADYNGENLYTGNPWTTCCGDDRWGSTSCNANTWTYWQVSSTGSIGGVSGNCDFDAYNGTLAELKSWQGI